MFCTNCGKELSDGTVFCPKCGTKVVGTESVSNQQNSSSNSKKSKFRILSKVTLLLVVFGFFMPISCNQNGFQLMDYCFGIGEIGSKASVCAALLGILFFAVVINIGLSIYNYVTKKDSKTALDIPCLLISISSGLVAFLLLRRADLRLQIGAIFIITGWLLSSLFLLLSSNKKSEQIFCVLCIITVIATVSITKIISYEKANYYSDDYDYSYNSGYKNNKNRGFGMEHIGSGSDGRTRAWKD